MKRAALALVLLAAGCDRRPGMEERQSLATAWADHNGIQATITCRLHNVTCDVVPKDARAPFRIDCYAAVDGWKPHCELSDR